MKLLPYLKRSACTFPSSNTPFGLVYGLLRHGAYLSPGKNIFSQMSPEHFDSRTLTLLEKKEHLKGKNSQNSVGKLFPSFTTHITLLPRSAGINQSEVIQNPFQQHEAIGETPSSFKGKRE